MKTTALFTGILLGACSLSMQANEASSSQEQTAELDTVKVSADFRELDLQQIPSAITVIGEDDIKNRNASHLETILSLAPNVNFAASSSRARYFQIRGIGERSQFVDPVNPSVGLIIDGIDMTGLGGAATLFDVEQVEILRGPQGIAFGANALAGAINIKSNQPTKETEGYVEAKVGNYNTQGLGGAISGSLTDNIQTRFAINQFKTDGYINNIHLNREDTNNIHETVARAQLTWQVNKRNVIDFTLLKADINNGYDAFSIDNDRNTYSDQPGKDTQDSTALSTTWNSKVSNFFDLQLNASSSKTESGYSYDEDWAFGNFDANYVCLDSCLQNDDGSFVYNYKSFDEYLRESSNTAIDLRITSNINGKIFNNSTDWIIGAYTSNKEVDLIRNYSYLGTTQYTSNIKTDSTAIYTELNTQLSLNNRLVYGIRFEDSSFGFLDSNDLSKSQSEVLWGGKISLESLLSLDHLSYISLSRGFKAGSVNSEPVISDDKRLYETEINHTLELGIKSTLLNDQLQTRVAAFFTQRDNQQVKQSFEYYEDDDPLELAAKFKDYFENAAKGHNYGVELESTYFISDITKLDLSLGLLKTEFIDYQFSDTDDDDNIIIINKDGRAQAHAPSYSASTALTHKLTNSLTVRIETELKNSFYYSDSHDEQSAAYQLWHASLNYTINDLELAIHGRNLTDKDYITKGFGFDNDPRDGYDKTQHTQLGDPRLITLQARYSF